jgi:hypothetical protein
VRSHKDLAGEAPLIVQAFRVTSSGAADQGGRRRCRAPKSSRRRHARTSVGIGLRIVIVAVTTCPTERADRPDYAAGDGDGG